MIETPQPVPHDMHTRRRPGLGRSVVRGLLILTRQYRAYQRTKYIALHDITGKDRADLNRAMSYIERLVSWKLTKDEEKSDE